MKGLPVNSLLNYYATITINTCFRKVVQYTCRGYCFSEVSALSCPLVFFLVLPTKANTLPFHKKDLQNALLPF